MTFLAGTTRRLGAAALLASTLGLAAACGGGSAPTPTPTAASTQKAAATTASASSPYLAMAAALEKEQFPADLEDGTALGKKDARVVIQAYEDFTCPHCLEFTATSEPGIIDQLVKPGNVRFEFHYFPLRQSSVPIMVAAQCAAGQDRFWDYQRLLFIAQAKADAAPPAQYAQAVSDAFTDSALKQMAASIGLDSAKFADCTTNSQPALDKIQADYSGAAKLGINGTPGFVVNGKFVGDSYPATAAAWKQYVDGLNK